ncbi:MAG TPA: M56 family metallopeptidase [Candidatus Dormibacteraeota bacterium]|nr:M56 family metallopeptidase [Candidatus Dormibacteraeota bacterium]
MILQPVSALWTAVAPAVGDHLWQSTIFAVMAGLLTLVLRQNHARARYWLWLAASVKFLVPFSVLVAMGSRLSWWYALEGKNKDFYFVIEGIIRPFPQPAISQPASATFFSGLARLLPSLLGAAWVCGFVIVLAIWLVRWQRVSAAIRNATLLQEGREVETLRRLEKAGGLRRRIEIFLSRASLEPGILGIVRPVLVWPAGISDQLEDAHLEAIVAHEVWHVRRNDNLAAAVHMLVEAIFWFHPLVWWLGARMVDERERACDEEVLQRGSQPQIYAESILKICEFCVGSPLACVAGVTGSDLKKRIVNIMNKTVVRKLNLAKKLLLGTAGMMAIALPIVFGLARPAQGSAPNTAMLAAGYQQVSVTPGETGNGIIQTRIMFHPDSFMAKNQTLQNLLKLAYGVQDNQISGGPDWISTAMFNIEAKLDSSAVAELKKLSPEQQKMERDQMFQSLLADQFKVALHRENKLLPAYALVIADSGPKVQPAKPGDTYPNGIKGLDGLPAGPHKFDMGPDGLTVQALPMSFVAEHLAMHFNQPVVDRTGLTGDYDFTLKFSPEGAAAHKEMHGGKETTAHTLPISSTMTALLAAIEDQLGLKLEPQTIPLPVLVVDRAENPSAI